MTNRTKRIIVQVLAGLEVASFSVLVLVERMGTHPQTLRCLRNRISWIGDLTHRGTLELVAEIAFAHIGLLASKLGKKASTNLGAIQGLFKGHLRQI